jgi:hypothetical protein
MIELLVPESLGPQIVISWAGNDPVTYVVKDGRVKVEEKYLDDFRALFPGAVVAPPAAQPAAKEKK